MEHLAREQGHQQANDEVKAEQEIVGDEKRPEQRPVHVGSGRDVHLAGVVLADAGPINSVRLFLSKVPAGQPVFGKKVEVRNAEREIGAEEKRAQEQERSPAMAVFLCHALRLVHLASSHRPNAFRRAESKCAFTGRPARTAWPASSCRGSAGAWRRPRGDP
jgi:hypothetical protein